MPIKFTFNRLHVGYIAKDWADVWYEPVGEPNAEGEAETGLYKITTRNSAKRDAQYREPMEGEVKWHPHFDPANCESKSKGEKSRLQKQFLTDAYRYLAERNPETIRSLEDRTGLDGTPGSRKLSNSSGSKLSSGREKQMT